MCLLFSNRFMYEFFEDLQHLLDFNSSPLYIKAQTDEPMQGNLAEGYQDALYNRSRGGLSPSGWSCKSLPYLVAFDEYGISSDPGRPPDNRLLWGYTEISWFSMKNREEQSAWLDYAYNWIRTTDPNGYLQMPVASMVTVGKAVKHRYKANILSTACPEGSGLELKIKELWSP